jgi:hypothetical protein
MMVSIKITVFWVVTPCDLLSVKLMESELVVFFIFPTLSSLLALITLNYHAKLDKAIDLCEQSRPTHYCDVLHLIHVPRLTVCAPRASVMDFKLSISATYGSN